jgi:peptide/nickel transport system substrate-binding protein
MKRMRWQILIVVIALAAIGILLLGQQPVTPQEAAASAQPVSGGTYSEALIGRFGRLNPVLDSFNQPDRDVNRLIFSSLIRFDDRGQPYGDLAESWGISQDGKVYNFSIRPEAEWHDGRPVTSEDVLFTIDLLRSDELPVTGDVREFWKQVESVSLDEKTLQFRLPEPYAPFLDHLTFGVLPKHLLAGLSTAEIIDAEFNLNPVGSGPFRFDKLITRDGEIAGVELASYDSFFGDKPFLDQVIFRYYPDAEAALTAYREGEVMGISQAAEELLPEILATETLDVHTGRLPQLSLIYLNLNDEDLPFFQDAAIRRALMMGLNRQWMIDRTLESQAIIADGPIFPGSWAYYDGIERIDYDTDQALKTIKEAGYSIPAGGGSVREKDGVELAFELVHPDTPRHAALAEAVRSDWAKLGVDVVLVPVPYEQLLADYLEPRQYQAALVDLNMALSPDPDPYPFWDQAQIADGQNYAQWNDRQASEFLERARVTTDHAERMKAYRNFQVRFTSELPALPLFYPVYSYAVDEQVQGVSLGPLYDISNRLNQISKWHLAAARLVPTASPSTPTP